MDSNATPAETPSQASSAAADMRDGLRDIAPVVVAVVPIGVVFGALCTGKGLSVVEAGLMSLLVFAGGAQFAAVELWSHPVPVAALAFSTLLINLRHVLMGASLAPKLAAFARLQKLAGLYLLADETWALAERRALRRALTPAYWFAMAAPLPLAWVCATVAGAWLGAFLGDQRRLGADFVFTALFIGLVAAFWRGRVTGYVVAASGAASALTHVTVGPPWHVGAGAFAGIAAAWCAASPGRRRPA